MGTEMEFELSGGYREKIWEEDGGKGSGKEKEGASV
jgi:hypothetical protein